MQHVDEVAPAHRNGLFTNQYPFGASLPAIGNGIRDYDFTHGEYEENMELSNPWEDENETAWRQDPIKYQTHSQLPGVKYEDVMYTIIHHCKSQILIRTSTATFDQHTWRIQYNMMAQRHREYTDAKWLSHRYSHEVEPLGGTPDIRVVGTNERCPKCQPSVPLSLVQQAEIQLLRKVLAPVWATTRRIRFFEYDLWVGPLYLNLREAQVGYLRGAIQVLQRICNFFEQKAGMLISRKVVVLVTERKEKLESLLTLLRKTWNDRWKARRERKVEQIKHFFLVLRENERSLIRVLNREHGQLGDTI